MLHRFRSFEALIYMMLQRDIYTTAYSGEISRTQLNTMTKAKFSDFTATLTYYYAEKVGGNSRTKDNAGLPNEYFILRAHTVDSNDLVREAMRYIELVGLGTAVLTNVAPTTTTTTAAP